MGLDAVVFCNCFETGNLKKAPRPEWGVYVQEDGRLECSCEDPDEIDSFDRWVSRYACEHEECMLAGHYIGNAWLVEFLRTTLEESGKDFPVLLRKVLYSGTHTGDWLSLEDVNLLRKELRTLSKIHCADSEEEGLIRELEQQMHELVEASLSIGKPICF